MHEWALAEAVISAAISTAEKERFGEITEIKIKLGELQQIEMDIFEFAIKEIIQPQNELLKDAKIKIELEKAIFKCRVCGDEWDFEVKKLDDGDSESIHFIPELAHVYMRCPMCGSQDFEVLRGRGVWIESITGTTPRKGEIRDKMR